MESEEIIEQDSENTKESEMNGDDIEAMLAEYDNKGEKSSGDVTAMQTVLCVIIAVFLFGLNAFYPEISGDVFSKITQLCSDTTDTFKNPIDTVLSML